MLAVIVIRVQCILPLCFPTLINTPFFKKNLQFSSPPLSHTHEHTAALKSPPPPPFPPDKLRIRALKTVWERGEMSDHDLNKNSSLPCSCQPHSSLHTKGKNRWLLILFFYSSYLKGRATLAPPRIKKKKKKKKGETFLKMRLSVSGGLMPTRDTVRVNNWTFISSSEEKGKRRRRRLQNIEEGERSGIFFSVFFAMA